MDADAPFLARQLESERIELLLLNGVSVVDTFSSKFGVELERQRERVSDRTVATTLWSGHYNEIRVIGWSTNLPSSFGVTRRLVAELAARIASLAGE